MIPVIQPEAANIVTLFAGDRREQLADMQDAIGDSAVEDCPVDLVHGDFFALDRVPADVSRGVDQLAQVDVVVFGGDEADEVCPRREGERGSFLVDHR
jgi:hypothetical protein